MQDSSKIESFVCDWCKRLTDEDLGFYLGSSWFCRECLVAIANGDIKPDLSVPRKANASAEVYAGMIVLGHWQQWARDKFR